MGKRIAAANLDRDQVDGDSEEFKVDALGDKAAIDSADQIA